MLYFVDRLDIRAALELARRTVSRNAAAPVRYLRSTSAGEFFARALGLSVAPLDDAIGDLWTPDGEYMQWVLEREIHAVCVSVSASLQDHPYARAVKEHLPAADVDLSIEKAARREIEPVVRLAVLARHYVRKEQDTGTQARVFVRDQGLAEAGAREWSERRVAIHLYGSESWERSLRRFLRNVRDRCVEWWAWRWGPGGRGEEHVSDRAPCVAVQLVEGIDPTRRSETFWVEGSGLDASQVLLYGRVEGLGGPPSADTLEEISRRGFRWVPLDRHVSPDGWRAVWAPRRRKVRVAPGRSLRRGASSEERWLCRQLVAFQRSVSYWLQFFRAHDVRVHVLIEEVGLQNVAQRAALRRAGGVTVGRQRSDLVVGSRTLGSFPADVFLVWNRAAVGTVAASRSRVPVCLVTGFVYDRAFAENRDRALRIRRRFTADVDFVVALFDNIFGPTKFYSESVMEWFYEPFLQWAREDRKLGLLVKPKKREFFGRLRGVPDVLDGFVREGRCVVLGDRGGVMPSTVATAADVSVGIGISSAITESLLAGQRAVYCDVTGYRSAPHYDWAPGRVLFPDPEGTVSALRAFRRGEEGARRVGDPGEDVEELDPFRDGRASARAGWVVGELYRHLGEGADPTAARREVTRSYGDRWGGSAVVPVGSPAGSSVGAGFEPAAG